MKRFWIILVALVLAVSLPGCSEEETAYTVSRNGMEFHVDTVQKTVTQGEHTYHYKSSGDSSDFSVTITYPNGSTYWYSRSGGIGGWSDDYDEGAYVSGDTLVDVLLAQAPRRANPGKLVGGLLLIALGLIDLIVPKVSWYLGYGWRYKDAEPSDAALVFARMGGAIAIAIGIALLFLI